MEDLLILIVILIIMWPIMKFLFKATIGITVLAMAVVSILWILFVMGGCSALLMM